VCILGHKLFRNPVVVKGYPIPRRIDWNTGLEIPLNILVGLARSTCVDGFNNKTYIKGFSTLLVASKQSNETIYWHLIFNEDGSQVYFSDDLLPPQQETQFSDVMRSPRHIVGQCFDASPHCPGNSGHIDRRTTSQSKRSDPELGPGGAEATTPQSKRPRRH
jgi:hypothetical protein